MFGIIALIVIQTAINVGLIIELRRTDREVHDILVFIDHIVTKLAEDREAINKLTYKP